MKNNVSNSKILALHDQIFNQHKSVFEITQAHLAIQNEQLKNEDNAVLLDLSENAKNYAKKLDEILNHHRLENQNNLLFGIPCSLKDNISVKDFITTGGSRFLETYVSPITATVCENLYKQDVVFLAKTNMDEFGLGGTGTFSGYGIVKNPFDPSRISGGSSSGSAVSVALGASVFSIGTDTGDSIRKPASYLGIVGYKPTYGIVSRYGVFPYSPSFDHVGVLATSVTDTAIVMDTIASFDFKDYSSQSIHKDFYKNLKEPSKLKVAVLDDVMSGLNMAFQPQFDQLFSALEKRSDVEVHHLNFDMNLLGLIDPIYQALSYSEAVSSWNNLNGMLFGNNKNVSYTDYEDLMHQLRTKYLGSQLKKRFVIGDWCTSNENFDDIYLKARRLVEIISARAKEIFETYDVVLMPGASDFALKLEDVLKNKVVTNHCDDALQIANFGGFPSLTIPFINEENKLFLGLNLWADNFKDQDLLNAGLLFEEIIGGLSHD